MHVDQTKYVDLNRRFHQLGADELADPEFLASLNHGFFHSGSSWDEILASPRVVVLAEGGAGKTSELKAEHQRKKRSGKFSFFVAMEQFKKLDFKELLDPEDEVQFNIWTSRANEPAWFFLDAVDELKLVRGVLDIALRKLSRALAGHHDRVRIVLSSRPHDWDKIGDIELLKHYFPAPRENRDTVSSEEVFLKGLRGTNIETEPKKTKPAAPFKTVMLLPLSQIQICALAEQFSVKNVSRLMDELDQRKAWVFAQRPQDLIDTVGFWNQHGRIGRRAEHIDFNVRKKLSEPDPRKDTGHLSLERALVGAERLALALALTQCRTLQDPIQPLDSIRAKGVLDPAEILTDWTVEERRALLRKPLFSIATYGRLRFHHPTVQDYLGAQCLSRQLENGLAPSRVIELLFGEQYGEELVRPSVASLAAWLSASQARILRMVKERAPEILLNHGDPESLPIDTRNEILNAYFGMHGSQQWNGIEIKEEAVKRIAHPGLSDVVRQVWQRNPNNQEVRELLASLICLGPLPHCVDIANKLLTGPSENSPTRLQAFRALRACGDSNTIDTVVRDVRLGGNEWNRRDCKFLLPELFADYLNVKDLMSIFDRNPAIGDDSGDLQWTLSRCLDGLDLSSDKTQTVLKELTAVVLDGVEESSPLDGISVRIAPFAGMLSDLCVRLIQAPNFQFDEHKISALAVASRFDEAGYNSRSNLQKIREFMAERPVRRRAAFWADVELHLELLSEPELDKLDSGLREHWLCPFLDQADRDWLEGSFDDDLTEYEALMAYDELLVLWSKRGRPTRDLNKLESLAAGKKRLERLYRSWTQPSANQKLFNKHERHRTRRRRIREIRQCVFEHKRLDWRSGLQTDYQEGLKSEKRVGTLLQLYDWLQGATGRSCYDNWNSSLMRTAFGDEPIDAAEAALRSLWREHKPPFLSERQKGARSSTKYVHILGLIGLRLESEKSGWAKCLTEDDIERAIRLAMIELNGISPTIVDLADAHPTVVEGVLSEELDKQIRDSTFEHQVPFLQDIAYGPKKLKHLMAPALQQHLINWSAHASELHSLRYQGLLHTLNILDVALQSEERRNAAATCLTAFEEAPDSELTDLWLLGILLFDPLLGCQTIVSALEQLGASDNVRPLAERRFASLFGWRSEFSLSRLSEVDMLEGMLPLVQTAYKFVKVKEDPPRGSSYTPDTRDKAENARSELLGALCARPGYETYQALHTLALDKNCAHFPDRLREMARQRAGKDCENVPYSPTTASRLSCGKTPKIETGAQLFGAFMGVLDEVAYDIEHGDFSDKALIARAEHESEVQATLAARIDRAQRNQFSLTRESETIDSKRTDIQAATPNGLKSVIEIKIAENHSAPSLVSDLEKQLVDRYLRDKNRKTGCFLLVCADSNRRWQLPGKTRMTVDDVIRELSIRAEELMRQEDFQIQLTVKLLKVF